MVPGAMLIVVYATNITSVSLKGRLFQRATPLGVVSCEQPVSKRVGKSHRLRGDPSFFGTF